MLTSGTAMCRKSTENIPDAYGEELAAILLLFTLGLGAGRRPNLLYVSDLAEN